MFLYQSNRLERLFAQLLEVCVGAPPADPFVAEYIVVQHPAMGQWIARQWALATGIAAQLAFPLPARALGELYRGYSDTPWDDTPWQTQVLCWRLVHLLPGYATDPAFAPLAPYLRGNADEVALFQLAGCIAAVFDQYQVYRPELLLGWEKGSEGTDWQAILWRRLCQDWPPHRAHLHLQCRRLFEQPPARPDLVPRRLHLFGISALAPVYLDLFVRIGRHVEIHCYHLSPCSQYWHDLAPARQQAQDTLLAFSTPLPLQENPLLVQLGQAGRDFARQLLDRVPDGSLDLYEEPQGTNLLHMLQRQMLHMLPLPERTERLPVAPGDRSVQLHLCFSPLREVQVLHDYLLDCFQEEPDLSPGDILVAAPDIGVYGAVVQAVFGEAPREHRIPWFLADQSLAADNAMARLFLALLDVLDSRCSSSELLDLLEHPALHRRFGLDVAQLPLAHRLVRDAGIFWGLDAEHRRGLGIDSGPEHTWRHGLDRLLLGYAMGPVDALHAGLLPCPPGGEEAYAVLGALLQLRGTLDLWRRRWQQARSAGEWPPLLLGLLDACLHPAFEEDGLGQLRRGIQTLAEELDTAGMDGMLAAPVLRLRLEELLCGPDGAQPFLSGRVTFCNMVPMRSLPFRIICLLGMNDGEFPRQQRPLSFDRMAKRPRLGDRNRRNDDRYLFLEAILSARSRLFLSWTGRNQRDGSENPPSAVISELCDSLDGSMQLEDDPEASLSRHLLSEHPLQPFSADNYNGRIKAPSYNRDWLPAAAATLAVPFLDSPLPASAAAAAAEVELAHLLCFWRNPARFFLRRSLGMAVSEVASPVADEEPFALDGLEHFHLRQEMLRRRLEGQDHGHITAMLAGQGLLPQGSFAGLTLDRLLPQADRLAEALHPHGQDSLAPMEVRLPFAAGGNGADTVLCGWLDHLYPGGRLVWSAGALGATLLLQTWICHLVLAALAPATPPVSTCIVCWDREQARARKWSFGAMAAARAHDLLQPYLQGFAAGQRQALPFFPKSALAWAKQMHKDGDAGKALAAACKAWNGGYQQEGECMDAAFRQLFPDVTALDESFFRLAALFLPLLKERQEEDLHAAP